MQGQVTVVEQVFEATHLAAGEVHAAALGEGILELAGGALDAMLFHVPFEPLGLKAKKISQRI